MSKNTRTRILLVAVAALLLVCVAVGGTIAYLQATSNEVVNTFKPTGLTIDINEHDYLPESNTLDTAANPVKANADYKVVPGVAIPKDPYISFTSDVSCYVFVTVKQENWNSALTYDLLEAWGDPIATTDDGAKVYAQLFTDENDGIIDAALTVDKLKILEGDKINVSADLSDMTGITANNPKLTFDAYIIQAQGFDSATAAWNVAKNSQNP